MASGFTNMKTDINRLQHGGLSEHRGAPKRKAKRKTKTINSRVNSIPGVAFRTIRHYVSQ